MATCKNQEFCYIWQPVGTYCPNMVILRKKSLNFGYFWHFFFSPKKSRA
jgi:hypothetical protein